MAGSEDGGALGGQTKNVLPEKVGAAHSLVVLDGRHHEHWMCLGLSGRRQSVSVAQWSLSSEIQARGFWMQGKIYV